MSAMQSHPIPRPSPLLRRREVEQLTGFKRSNIYKLMATGAFPRPVKVGARAVRWREADVTAWLAELPTATGDGPRA